MSLTPRRSNPIVHPVKLRTHEKLKNDPVAFQIWRDGDLARRRKRHAKDPRPVMLRLAKCRAKKKGVAFDLDIDDIIIPDQCPVLRIKIEVGSGRLTDNSPTIDRINPKKGYVRGNVSVISWRANVLKKDATLAELKALVSYVENANGKNTE
jgi:hypothetical protein